MRYTVTSIEVSDQTLLETVTNLDEFAGRTLYDVRGHVEVLALFGRGTDMNVGGPSNVRTIMDIVCAPPPAAIGQNSSRSTGQTIDAGTHLQELTARRNGSVS